MLILPDNPGCQLTQTSVAQDWTVTGAGGLDEWTVRAAILATVPQTNAPPSSPYAWPIRGLQLKEREASTGVWKFSVTWGTLVYQVSGKIGGQQQQVRTSKIVSQIYGSGYPSEWSAGDQGRPIGWDGRTVHGCSIYAPQETWTESVEIPVGDFTGDYKQAVRGVARAPVNSAAFRAFAAGEVLFLGMQYQASTQTPDFISASFEFSASANADPDADPPTPITIGSMSISKVGWDYLDVHFAAGVDAAAKTMEPKPDYAVVHRVYSQSDFAGLNIGTDDSLPLWEGGS